MKVHQRPFAINAARSGALGGVLQARGGPARSGPAAAASAQDKQAQAAGDSSGCAGSRQVEPVACVHTRLAVPSIRCAGCIAKIERGLSELDGVIEARVNFSARCVHVRHEPRLREEDLVTALDALGFEAQAVDLEVSDPAERERRELLRALAVAGFGMMNIMLLSVSIWAGAQGATREMFHWLSALIALPVIAYSGRIFFSSAFRALRRGRTNMDVPISIGVVLATALSLYETIRAGPHAYFESAVMLLFFLLAGRALDAMMRGRTRAGIGALLSRMGRRALVLAADGTSLRIDAQALLPGMVMLVASGEALAADGVIEQGSSMIDNSMLTGESAAEAVGPGSMLHAGAINLGDPIRVRITAAQGDTVVAQIARLMEEASQSRSRYMRIADRAARAYAPAVHSLALLALTGWLIAGAGWYQSLVIAISVLIITCPCAIGLAVPAAQVVANGALLSRGVLVKDGSALERLAEIDIALFDKTGTLTLGEPRAQLSGLDHQYWPVLLALAQASQHPLSRGLARQLMEQGVRAATVEDLREQPGKGLSARWQGEIIALERMAWPGGEADIQADVDRAKDPGRTAPMVSLASSFQIGDKCWTIAFSDPLREDASDAVEQLSAMGIEARIVSGDRADAVEAVASQLGIEGIGELDPRGKHGLLDQLRRQGRRTLMVGDGINDAPALAAAHASLAPASASDVGKQATDAVFLGARLMPVVVAVRAARATMDVVRQNLAAAMLYNLLAVPLALAGMVTPLIAAAAMSASSLVVVANSLRLARAAR